MRNNALALKPQQGLAATYGGDRGVDVDLGGLGQGEPGKGEKQGNDEERCVL
jgi:hypothetical protein